MVFRRALEMKRLKLCKVETPRLVNKTPVIILIQKHGNIERNEPDSHRFEINSNTNFNH